MIVLNLTCSAGHHFEGWFASSDAFESQLRQSLVCCPHCESTIVARLPSGPYVAKPRAANSPETGDDATVEAILDQLRHLGEGSEDVGERFPDEARRIHRQEIPKRAIKGQASLDDMRDLLEEGIPVLPIPGKKTSH
jgi:hypothetical protein